jgi:flagellar biosynthesis protein FlhF
MKLKRFVAQDAKKALQMVKDTFGNDAVILSSHSIEDGVEVVAAIDYDETVINQQAAIDKVKDTTPLDKAISPFDDMKCEIQTLRNMIENQFSMPQSTSLLQNILQNQLISLGMENKFAIEYTKRIDPRLNAIEGWKKILDMIREKLPLYRESNIESGGVYAFIGPTGVGKTTTIAKIAARFALRYGAENLGLVTMDCYRIAAHEQLMMYGKILGVNVCIAEDEASLTRTMRKLSSKKLVLIDTAGMNPNDARVKEQLQRLENHSISISKVLVLSATSHYQVLSNAINKYNDFNISQCILTKIDEALSIGAAIGACIQANIPISYITNGQRVPEDIKIAAINQFIDLLNEGNSKINFKECGDANSFELGRRPANV